MERHSETLGTSPSHFKLPHLKPGTLSLTRLCECQCASSIPVKIVGAFAVPSFSTVGSLKSLLTSSHWVSPAISAPTLLLPAVTFPTPSSPPKGPFPICPPIKLSSCNQGKPGPLKPLKRFPTALGVKSFQSLRHTLLLSGSYRQIQFSVIPPISELSPLCLSSLESLHPSPFSPLNLYFFKTKVSPSPASDS